MSSRLLAEFYATPLAIVPGMIAPIRDVLVRHAAGIKLSADEIAAAVGRAPAEAAARRARPQPRGVFVLPVLGILSQRGGVDATSTALTSVDSLRRHFASAVENPEVGTVLLEIDSPGGSVVGIEEFAADVMAARSRKRIVAHANSLMASAAYWIASSAHEIVASPSSQIGSIGVLVAHENHASELHQKGVAVTLISAGRFKTEANPFEELSAEARQAMQGRVDEYYGRFVSDVARGRGVKPADVRNGFGQGRVVGAREAVALGMADRIATIEQTIQRAFGGEPTPRAAVATTSTATPLKARAEHEFAQFERRKLRTRRDYELQLALIEGGQDPETLNCADAAGRPLRTKADFEVGFEIHRFGGQ
jgi:signal peptide peptidase SppA